jgi:phage-related protein
VRGITIIFNNEEIHTGDDLDLVQEKKEIGKPKPQIYTVEVPGRNGLLNLTKGLTGRVTYYNRPLSFQYFGTGDRESLLELDAKMSKYHGQTIRIIDDDYPDHYYEGEATVESKFYGNYIIITLDVDAQPFRLKRDLTVSSRDINGAVKLYLNNESIEAIPTITITAETVITFNGVTMTLNAGTYTVESFELHSGVNIFEVSGTGTITIEYQEGAI